ncbi:MAG: 2-methylcitrate dehydratase [Magnetococcales bacterium]|nr:2-methylcitrate dehydratase [Magnetococcales bacterium]
MSSQSTVNMRPDYDDVMMKIADYVMGYNSFSEESLQTARYCLMDSLACGLMALQFDACKKHLGALPFANENVETGVPIPGTHYKLDPVTAAFNIGCMIRWLDYNDTWLAAEWGHPSDNLGAILAVAYMNKNLTMDDVLKAMVLAHEVQGVIALENSFNKVGLDHVVLVKIASAAVAAKLLGYNKEGVLRALSQVFVDGQSLRTYRHAPNAGRRKSWAAGDATSRAVRLAYLSEYSDESYPSALTAPVWGFYDVLFKGKEFKFQRDFGCYVMEQVLFKISYPAEFHAQTAVECAIKIHPQLNSKSMDDIDRIELTTHESAIRIIAKDGKLNNPADRDHCLQYMVACGLLFGDLTADMYEDSFDGLSNVDLLRAKMEVKENKQFSEDYHDPEKRSIANSVQIFFNDGTSTEKVTVEYPIGHRRRREEGMPVLVEKFKKAVRAHYTSNKANDLINMFEGEVFKQMDVQSFMKAWST